NDEVPLKRRKGVYPIKPKCDVIREARVKGQNYTNWKGEMVVSKCTMKCFER
ncbi:hypothetical protein J6590_107908, partial [Homalodisca vitripennis]